MKKRILCLVGCMLGALIAAAPYCYAFVMSEVQSAPGVSIIGGADGPTSILIVQEVTREYFWLICVGGGMILASVAALLWRRK